MLDEADKEADAVREAVEEAEGAQNENDITPDERPQQTTEVTDVNLETEMYLRSPSPGLQTMEPEKKIVKKELEPLSVSDD